MEEPSRRSRRRPLPPSSVHDGAMHGYYTAPPLGVRESMRDKHHDEGESHFETYSLPRRLFSDHDVESLHSPEHSAPSKGYEFSVYQDNHTEDVKWRSEWESMESEESRKEELHAMRLLEEKEAEVCKRLLRARRQLCEERSARADMEVTLSWARIAEQERETREANRQAVDELSQESPVMKTTGSQTARSLDSYASKVAVETKPVREASSQTCNSSNREELEAVELSSDASTQTEPPVAERPAIELNLVPAAVELLRDADTQMEPVLSERLMIDVDLMAHETVSASSLESVSLSPRIEVEDNALPGFDLPDGTANLKPEMAPALQAEVPLREEVDNSQSVALLVIDTVEHTALSQPSSDEILELSYLESVVLGADKSQPVAFHVQDSVEHSVEPQPSRDEILELSYLESVVLGADKSQPVAFHVDDTVEHSVEHTVGSQPSNNELLGQEVVLDVVNPPAIVLETDNSQPVALHVIDTVEHTVGPVPVSSSEVGDVVDQSAIMLETSHTEAPTDTSVGHSAPTTSSTTLQIEEPSLEVTLESNSSSEAGSIASVESSSQLTITPPTSEDAEVVHTWDTALSPVDRLLSLGGPFSPSRKTHSNIVAVETPPRPRVDVRNQYSSPIRESWSGAAALDLCLTPPPQQKTRQADAFPELTKLLSPTRPLWLANTSTPSATSTLSTASVPSPSTPIPLWAPWELKLRSAPAQVNRTPGIVWGDNHLLISSPQRQTLMPVGFCTRQRQPLSFGGWRVGPMSTVTNTAVMGGDKAKKVKAPDSVITPTKEINRKESTEASAPATVPMARRRFVPGMP